MDTSLGTNSQIIAMARGLVPDATSLKQLCPFCWGGKAKELSFNVTLKESGQLLYICHRATCNRKGRAFLSDQTPGPSTNVVSITRKKAANFVGALESMPSSISAILANRYGITASEIKMHDLRWAPEEEGGRGRLWLPIRSSSGAVIGAVLRSLDKDVKPKSKTFMYDTNHPLMSVYRGYGETRAPALMIVEDILSAIKLKRHCERVVALLGAHMDDFKMHAIKRMADNDKVKIVWALDPDIFDLTLKLRSKFGPIAGDTKIVKPRTDFKDMEDDDIRATLSEALR